MIHLHKFTNNGREISILQMALPSAVLKSSSSLLRSVLTCDASIRINISIRSLCASEDSHDISKSTSFGLMLMFMLMFNEDIIDISIKCSLIG